MEYAIVCPLALIAGFVDAVAGGGGLIALPAFLFAGLPVHLAIGTSKLTASMGTLASTWRYAVHGYMVKPLVVVGVICGLTGSFFGGNAVLATDDIVVKWLMLLALPLIAFFVLRNRDLDRFADDAFPLRKTAIITGCIALVVGFYDGFYGPGTGTFLILLLTAVGHLSLKAANGTTKAINLATNLSALAVFIVNGNVMLQLGLIAGVFNIAGNLLGAHFFHSNASRITRPIVCVVLVLFAIKLISDLFGA